MKRGKKENMATRKAKLTKLIISIFSLTILIFIISGQTQCPGQQTQAAKTGLDFYLDTSQDFLYEGKQIYQGETFNVGIIVENYDLVPRNGRICIKDDVSDSFLGISSSGEGDCQVFSVKAAEETEQKSGAFGNIQKIIIPGKTEVFFPTNGQYKYLGLPKVNYYTGRLFVSAFYRQTTRATTTLVLPGNEQPKLEQQPAPIFIGLSQSTHRKDNNYQTDLTITLNKQSSAKIFSNDFLKENVTYFNAEVTPQQLYCYKKTGEQITNLLELTNENIIKCSFLIPSTNAQSYPFVLTLDYGVEVPKQYNFQIKTS